MASEEKERVPCGKCGRETNHTLRGKVTFDDLEVVASDEDGVEVGYYNWWELLQCDGCSYAQLRVGRFFSELDRQFDEPEISYWPPHEKRRRPGWVDQLKPDQRHALEEVYTAIDLGLNRLAMMGVRSVIDVFLVGLVGKDGGFEQKLEKAANCEHVSRRELEMLRIAVEAGHAAIHRGHSPSDIDIRTALEVAESVVRSSLLKPKADALKERTPKRGKQ